MNLSTAFQTALRMLSKEKYVLYFWFNCLYLAIELPPFYCTAGNSN